LPRLKKAAARAFGFCLVIDDGGTPRSPRHDAWLRADRDVLGDRACGLQRLGCVQCTFRLAREPLFLPESGAAGSTQPGAEGRAPERGRGNRSDPAACFAAVAALHGLFWADGAPTAPAAGCRRRDCASAPAVAINRQDKSTQRGECWLPMQFRRKTWTAMVLALAPNAAQPYSGGASLVPRAAAPLRRFS